MRVKVLPHEPVTNAEKEEEEALFKDSQFDYIAYEKDHTVKETAHGQEKLARAFSMKTEDLFGGEYEETQAADLRRDQTAQ